MTLLKELIENVVNEKEDDARVNFHSYLTGKMQKLKEGYSELDHVLDLDRKIIHGDNQKAVEEWEESVYKIRGSVDSWQEADMDNILAGIDSGEQIVSKYEI